MGFKLYVSGIGVDILYVEILDDNQQVLGVSWKRAYLRGFRHMKRELSLQYLGYSPSHFVLLKLMIREFSARLLNNGFKSILELLVCYEATFSSTGGIDFPISLVDKKNNKTFWVSRFGILSGVKSSVYGPEIEWDRARFSSSFCGFIWGIESEEKFNLREVGTARICKPKGLHLIENLQLDTDLIEKDTNYKTIERCIVINGLFALKDGVIHYLDCDHSLEDISWPTNFPSSLFGNLKMIAGIPMFDVEAENAVLFGSSTSWFHFLVDVLPKLLNLDYRENTQKTLILRKQPPLNIMTVIDRLGFNQVVVMRDGQSLQVQKLEMVSDLREKSVVDIVSRKQDVNRVRDFLTTGDKLSTDSPFIFVERDPKLFRPLANSEQLRLALLKLGFLAVRPEKLALDEQIRVFGGAKFVVAESGAALTNIVFMSRGSTVVELSGGNNNYLWMNLSEMLGINHKIIFGKPRYFSNFLSGDGSFRVDVKDTVRYITAQLRGV